MPGYVDIQIVGDTKGVEAMLMHLGSKLDPNYMAAWMNSSVGPYLAQRAQARFSGEGDDVVGQWAPLSPATQNIRASQGFPASNPINNRTGQLENYIVNSGSAVSINAAGATLTFPGTPASGELADKVQTAQIGRDVPNTVARPVLGVNQTDLQAVLTMMALEIQRP